MIGRKLRKASNRKGREEVAKDVKKFLEGLAIAQRTPFVAGGAVTKREGSLNFARDDNL